MTILELSDCPRVGEVFATEDCHGLMVEFALTWGACEFEPSWFGIGLRIVGGAKEWESAGYGYSPSAKAVIVRRFVVREIARGTERITVTHPWVSRIWEGVAAASRRRAERAAAAEETKRRAEAARAARNAAFLSAVDAVILPKGRRIEVTLPARKSGSVQEVLKVTAYGGWGIARAGALFRVYHLGSLKTAGQLLWGFSGAQRIIRGLLLAGGGERLPEPLPADLLRMSAVIRAIHGEDAPTWWPDAG